MKTNNLYIVEGAESVWHYHISKTGKNGDPPLCKKGLMMHTEIPLSCWGRVSHLGERYCKECEQLAGSSLAHRINKQKS